MSAELNRGWIRQEGGGYVLRDGEKSSPIAINDNLKLAGWVVRVVEDPTKGLGFWLEGKLTKVFQPIRDCVGKKAARVID